MRGETGYPLRVSTDIGGLGNGIKFVDWLYCEAGFRNFGHEVVAFPHMTASMLLHYFAEIPFKEPINGVHSVTGQLHKNFFFQNTIPDMIKLAVAEHILADLSYQSDLSLLRSVKKLGQNRPYWLTHETEIDSIAIMKQYVKIFSSKEFSEIDLLLELSPVPGSPGRTLDKVNRMRDMGLTNIKPAGDTVHYWRGKGKHLSDIKSGSKFWGEMLTWFENAKVDLIHFSHGPYKGGDAHDMKLMSVEKGMLKALGEYRKEAKVPILLEYQETALGPKDAYDTIEMLKWLGCVELRAKIIDECSFAMR